MSTALRHAGASGEYGPYSDLELIDRVDRALDVLHGNCLTGASKKVMTDTLRALERDGLVTREVFAEVPTRVEYSLTPLGWTMTEPLIALAEWGARLGEDVIAARSSHSPHAGVVVAA